MTIEVTDITCHGDTNGTLKVHDPDSCYDYVLWRYTLFNPQIAIDTGSYFTELIEGVYVIEAISKSGTCKDSSVQKYISDPPPVVYQATANTVYCITNGACNGSISLDGLPVGGNPPYQYYINEIYTNIPFGPINANNIFSNVCPGEYEVQVVDAKACVFRDTISVLDSSLSIDSIVSENSSCFGYNNGHATVYVSGGVGSYSYVWSHGDTAQTADSLSPGVYGISI